MGIIIIFGVILIIGIAAFIVYQHTAIDEWCFGTGIMCTMLGGFGILLCGAICLCTLNNANVDYAYMLDKREAIEYRLEQIEKDENLLVNGGVYDDIVEYNAEVRYYKTWCIYNFWTGWFNPAPIDELEYIDLYKGVS